MRYRSVPYLVASATLCIGHSAHAIDYLTVSECQTLMFADAGEFVPVTVTPTSEQLSEVEQKHGGPVNPRAWTVWAAKKDGVLLGYVATDAVIGKFQLINYAVAYGLDGTIRDIEILSYREAHGSEVRNASWRAQFVGRSGKSAVRVGQDISNISGATLSCTHLTDGIRGLSAWVEAALVHG